MGKGVLVLDAFDGTRLATLATDRSVAASVTLIDSDYDGIVDRAYAVDLGANVYRIDFETAAGAHGASDWTITKIAALGDGTNSRKFFYEPDVVLTSSFTAIMVGSGNREQPLLTTSNDRFFTLFDYRVGKGAPTTPVVSGSALNPTSSSFALNGTVPGCYYPLATTGEKVVTGAVSTGGFSYFSTNEPTPPAPNSCTSNLGRAKSYRVPLFCGNPDYLELAGGGLPPTPVIGNVEIDVPANGNVPATTRTVPFIIGGFNPELSPIGVSRVPVAIDPTRRRLYWFAAPTR
jgi:type IV pilus assembly protein PilY1